MIWWVGDREKPSEDILDVEEKFTLNELDEFFRSRWFTRFQNYKSHRQFPVKFMRKANNGSVFYSRMSDQVFLDVRWQHLRP